MGTNQGLFRLMKGIERSLTASEVSRGYLFISKDKAVQKLLGKNFSVKICSEILEKQNIDGSGRIIIGKTYISKLKNREFKIILETEKIIIQ